jgi:hypothetical protein
MSTPDDEELTARSIPRRLRGIPTAVRERVCVVRCVRVAR